jgi:hypothetical protein
VYLTEVPIDFAEILTRLIGKEAEFLADRADALLLRIPVEAANADLEIWEHYIESQIESDPQLPETERCGDFGTRRVFPSSFEDPVLPGSG